MWALFVGVVVVSGVSTDYSLLYEMAQRQNKPYPNLFTRGLSCTWTGIKKMSRLLWELVIFGIKKYNPDQR
jgi:hypothetical protein